MGGETGRRHFDFISVLFECFISKYVYYNGNM